MRRFSLLDVNYRPVDYSAPAAVRVKGDAMFDVYTGEVTGYRAGHGTPAFFVVRK